MADKPSILQIIASVLAGFFGVQSEHNRNRDFSSGSIASFIFWGLLSAGAFVLIVMFMVSWALSLSGA